MIVSRDNDLRNIDQYGLESWIIATLSTERRGINIPTIIEKAPTSLVVTIEDATHLEQFLWYLESKDLLRHDGQWWNLTNNGRLHFRKFIQPISQALQHKKRYEDIINSGDASDDVKKDLKKFLGTVRDKVPDKITSEIIQYMMMRGEEQLWELIRIIMEFGNNTV